jgi:hypothetical protein
VTVTSTAVRLVIAQSEVETLRPVAPGLRLRFAIEHGWQPGLWARVPAVESQPIGLVCSWPFDEWDFKIGSRVARGTHLVRGAVARRRGRAGRPELAPRWRVTCPDGVASDVLGRKAKVATA